MCQRKTTKACEEGFEFFQLLLIKNINLKVRWMWGISSIVTDFTGGLIVPQLHTADILMCYVTALAKWEKNVPSEDICSSLKRRSGLYSSLSLSSSLFLSAITSLSVSKFPVQITVKQKVPSYKELNKKCSISFDQGTVKFSNFHTSQTLISVQTSLCCFNQQDEGGSLENYF